MNYHLVVLGCQMNHSDSERVNRIMADLGYHETNKEEEADIIGIIACSVRQKAIDKVYSKIAKWNKWKDKRGLITFVSGCILPDDQKKFLGLFDLVFDMKEVEEFPKMLREYGVNIPNSNFYLSENESIDEEDNTILTKGLDLSKVKLADVGMQAWNVEPIYNSTFEAFIPIQNGCNKFCTYCAVPYTRGREVSRPSEEIMGEVKKLVDNNYKSITLLGQNVNSYGLDKKGDELSFAQLLDGIGKIIESSDKDVWVYYTSPHPRDMTRDVIEVMAKYKGIAKQVHLPLQSGDEKVLIRMNRKHSVDKYREIVKWIRELMPQSTIFTDIIVGFSGETDEQFESTRMAMKEFEYNMAYIAMYSPRPGATSFKWKDDVPHSVKKQRYATLTEDLTIEAQKWSDKMVGQTYKVLVRGKDRKEGYLSAYTEGKVIVRFVSNDESLIGQFVNVKIDHAGPFSGEGTLVERTVEVNEKVLG